MAANVGLSSDDDSLLSGGNSTRLLGLMLALLIAFVIFVTALASSKPIRVNFPETGPSCNLEILRLSFSLRREDDGDLGLYYEDCEVDAASIRTLLEQVGVPPEDQPIRLAVDRNIPYGEIVKTMDLLQSLGLKKISVDTRHVDAK